VAAVAQEAPEDRAAVHRGLHHEDDVEMSRDDRGHVDERRVVRDQHKRPGWQRERRPARVVLEEPREAHVIMEEQPGAADDAPGPARLEVRGAFPEPGEWQDDVRE
jgi:hypothetical protein